MNSPAPVVSYDLETLFCLFLCDVRLTSLGTAAIKAVAAFGGAEIVGDEAARDKFANVKRHFFKEIHVYGACQNPTICAAHPGVNNFVDMLFHVML